MKALSVQWPWSWAILRAGKDIENRNRATSFRGRVLIHTGKTVDKEAVKMFREAGYPLPANPPLGCVLGSVSIVDCVTESNSEWFGGPYGYVVRAPREYADPIPCVGQLGFFDVPHEVAEAVMKQLAC